MKPRIVSNIAPADMAVLDGLAITGVATTHEAMGRSGLMEPAIRPVVQDVSIAGRAVTVLATAGDNWMLQAAVEHCKPGDVIVLGVTSPCTDGYLGDMIATALQARGVRAAVLDVGCRDVRTLRKMRFPVWSRAVSAQGTVKATPGCVNVPVVCGGVLVEPGDIVVADDDGVVIVPRAIGAEVLEKAQARMAREDAARPKLATGAPLGGFEASKGRLKEMGMEYVDAQGR